MWRPQTTPTGSWALEGQSKGGFAYMPLISPTSFRRPQRRDPRGDSKGSGPEPAPRFPVSPFLSLMRWLLIPPSPSSHQPTIKPSLVLACRKNRKTNPRSYKKKQSRSLIKYEQRASDAVRLQRVETCGDWVPWFLFVGTVSYTQLWMYIIYNRWC